MKREHKKRKIHLPKKVMIALLACAVSVLAVGGIVFGVKKTVTASRVMVIQAAEIADYAYWEDEETEEMEGEVFSGASQSVFVSSSQTVKEVKVKEGQSVKKGDVLMIYDTKELEIDSKKAELARMRNEKALEVAQRNLRTLQSIKPTSGEDDEGDDFDDEPDEGDDQTSGEKTSGKKKKTPANPYQNVKAVSVLNAKSKAYNDKKSEKNLGSADNPYRFLCRDEADIEAGFIRAMKAKADKAGKSVYFVVEVRKGDTGKGALQKAWLQDAKLLADVDDSWHGTLRFAEEQKEKEDEDQTDGEDQTPDEPENDSGDQDNDADNADHDSSVAGASAVFSRYRVVLLSSRDSDEEEDDGDWESVEEESLISPDDEYSREELSEAITEENKTIKDLQLNLKEADLKIKKLKAALKAGTVKAKNDGVVIRVGDPANPPQDGSAFLLVGAHKGMSVRGAVSERLLDTVGEGTSLRVNSWQSGEEYMAEITDISLYPDTSGSFSMGEANTSYYPFTADILGDTGALEEGEWVTISLVREPGKDDEAAEVDEPAETEEFDVDEDPEGDEEFDEDEEFSEDEEFDEEFGDTLYLLKAFIRSDEKGKFVFMRGKGNKLTKQYIEVGKNTGDAYEIVSGVSPEDWIAFPYGKDAREGAKTREGSMEDLESM